MASPKAYRQGTERVAALARPVLDTDCAGRQARPAIYRASAADLMRDHAPGEEVFGPLELIVSVGSDDVMLAWAGRLHGQPTATL